MSRRLLRATLFSARGAKQYPLVHKRVEDMTVQEAEQWSKIIDALLMDARSEGKRAASRYPGRRF